MSRWHEASSCTWREAYCPCTEVNVHMTEDSQVANGAWFPHFLRASVHAQGEGTHEMGSQRGLAKNKERKKKRRRLYCLFRSSCGSMCIRKSHVVTCAWGQRGWHSRSSFRSPVKPYSRKSLQAFRIWNVFLLDERGGVVTSERRKWVWKSQCVCSMSPCPPQVSHMPRKLPLSHIMQKNLTSNICVRREVTACPELPPHTRPHTYTHTLLEQSVLTRVSGGIKEALRAKQQSSTCFLKKRKQKRQGTLFSNDSRSLRGNVHRITEQTF